MKKTTRCCVLAGLALAACSAPAPRTYEVDAAAFGVPAEWPHPLGRDVVSAASGLITTDAPLGTQVGLDILRAGGNAVDAAVATAFALAVVYPEAGNIGGGGFLVVRMADGAVASLDFRERAPAAATRDMYLDERGEPTDRSVTGHLASGVPGAVAGLWAAHQRFGSMPWADLVAPSIALAERGFEVDAELAASVREAMGRLGRFDASAALFAPGGTPLAEGSTWRVPELAATLRRIAQQGPDGFYRGATADLIVAEMRRGGGIITHADLAAYEAVWREPVVFDYRGHTVISMPPPSSGGLTLALIANILAGYDVRASGWNSPRTLHLTAEAMRRAFADRNEFLGDSDFVPVPREQFLASAYADRLRAGIDEQRATPSAQVTAGGSADGDHTTHFSIVDRHGNAVALTTTINSLYGSAVTVGGAGFLLNNEMDDFTAKPGVPNQFGLVQGEANAIEPGKRMLSAMTPTIVVRDGAPVIVTGARGGPRIITAVWQVFSNIVDHGMPVGAAVNAPRIHHQHLPDILYYEAAGLPDAAIETLRTLGHDVRPRAGYVGVAPTIVRRGSQWLGVEDPRRGGARGAAGY
jgi:gamma-glutamyltranspeptidase / glutathione hydrolase